MGSGSRVCALLASLFILVVPRRENHTGVVAVVARTALLRLMLLRVSWHLAAALARTQMPALFVKLLGEVERWRFNLSLVSEAPLRSVSRGDSAVSSPLSWFLIVFGPVNFYFNGLKLFLTFLFHLIACVAFF